MGWDAVDVALSPGGPGPVLHGALLWLPAPGCPSTSSRTGTRTHISCRCTIACRPNPRQRGTCDGRSSACPMLSAMPLLGRLPLLEGASLLFFDAQRERRALFTQNRGGSEPAFALARVPRFVAAVTGTGSARWVNDADLRAPGVGAAPGSPGAGAGWQGDARWRPAAARPVLPGGVPALCSKPSRRGASLPTSWRPSLSSAVVEMTTTSGQGVCMMECPSTKDPSTEIRARLPILVLTVKNMEKYFSFEVQIRGEDGVVRRLVVSNRNHEASVVDTLASLPLRLDEGWNLLRFDAEDVARRAFEVAFREVTRVRVHASCRVARVFLASRDEAAAHDLPPEFLAMLPPGMSPIEASTRSPRWAEAPLWGEDRAQSHLHAETRHVSPLKPPSDPAREPAHSVEHSAASDAGKPMGVTSPPQRGRAGALGSATPTTV